MMKKKRSKKQQQLDYKRKHSTRPDKWIQINKINRVQIKKKEEEENRRPKTKI